MIIEGSRENITTISDVIRRAGGITSLTDLSNIEINSTCTSWGRWR